MDWFKFDDIKMKKENVVRMCTFVRLIDACFALLLISWSSVYLPTVVKVSGEILRELSRLMFNTHAVFVIGNVIIIALVAQSGKFSSQSDDGKREVVVVVDDFYDEYIKIIKSKRRIIADVESCTIKEKTKEEKSVSDESNRAVVVVDDFYDEYVKNIESKRRIIADDESRTVKNNSKEEKPVISSENAVTLFHRDDSTAITTVPAITECRPDKTKPYKRSKSETYNRYERVKAQKDLRRSATDVSRKNRIAGPKTDRRANAVDKLSNEEFQQAIEAFIEKQQRFLRQEYKSIVLADQN